MGIELRITSVDAGGESTTSVKRINEYDITVGCYNDDNVKLKSQLLQGSHIRLSSEWSAETGKQRLIITNISGNTSIFVNNEALESDQYREIDETAEIRLGQYTLAARDTSINFLTSTENSNSDFSLENFSPNEFSLDTAMLSLMQPTETVPERELHQTAVAPIKDSTSHTTAAIVKAIPKTEVEQIKVVTTEVPALQTAKKPTPTNTSNVVPLPSDETASKQDTVDKPKLQTLFEGVVGLDDIVELNFDAFRLYSISGQIVHHQKPLEGVVLDGGALGVTKTDAKGNFSFNNIAENTQFRITPSCDGFMMAKNQNLSGTINSNIKHSFNAIKLSRVAGRIVHGGNPLPGVTLDAGPHGVCITDADGYYQFDNVPENTDLEIRALGAGFMFKRAGNNSAAEKPIAASAMKPAISAAPAAESPELDDSIAALVGARQSVA